MKNNNMKKCYKVSICAVVVCIIASLVSIIGITLHRNCGGGYLNCATVIYLPNMEYGFTCTGAFYDEDEGVFYVGNIGKESPTDTNFHSQINVLEEDLNKVTETIELYSQFPDMQDVQGITKDKNGNVWFCSCNEGYIRCIDSNLELLYEFPWESPSGIVYDEYDDTLLVLDFDRLTEIDFQGNIVSSWEINIQAQDQLCLLSSNILLFTAGDNYNKEQFLYIFDLDTGELSKRITLENCFAVEGICVVDEYIYVFNDGKYHSAKIQENYCVIFYVSDVISYIKNN